MDAACTLKKVYISSISKKIVMAVTGAILFGFVVVHTLGNLQIFMGPDKINDYAELLQNLGELLWAARIILLISLVLHIFTAVALYIENRTARSVQYVCDKTVKATYASRTMLVSGGIVLAFVIFHLLDFTFGYVAGDYYHLTDAQGRHDVYRMVVLGFRHSSVSISYIIAMLILCIHIRHGFASLFQSLGLTNEKLLPLLEKAALAISVIIFIGSCSIPAACYLRIIGGGL